jgi:tripeptide aminopeptidase
VAVVADEVLELFLELVRVPSPPGGEREVVDLCGRYLTDLGLEWDEDDAAGPLGGTAGNLYCRIRATAGGEGGTALFFCAHTDTVPHEVPIHPVVRDGVVTNDEDGILGADNKATVAGMLDAVRRIVQGGIPHAGIELVLTPQEEVGLRGAKAFDADRLHARIGYVFDHASPIGGMVLEAPSQYSIDARFVGREAHSGIAPDEGRSAIAAAARAIAEMRLGRIDDETTANVGLLRGGSARNIVAGSCTLSAEARSLDPGKALRQCQAMIDSITHAADAEGCEVETHTRPIGCAGPSRSSPSPSRRSRPAATCPRRCAPVAAPTPTSSTRAGAPVSTCRTGCARSIRPPRPSRWPMSTASSASCWHLSKGLAAGSPARVLG